MTNAQRIRQIMAEERQVSMRQVNDLPQETWEPALEIFHAIQEAINNAVQRRDGAIPTGLAPAVLRIAADEMDRIGGRLSDEGLLYGEGE